MIIFRKKHITKFYTRTYLFGELRDFACFSNSNGFGVSLCALQKICINSFNRQKQGLTIIISVEMSRKRYFILIQVIKYGVRPNCIFLGAFQERICLSFIQLLNLAHKVLELMHTPETQVKTHPFLHSSLLASSPRPSKVSKTCSRGHWKPSEQQCYTEFLRKNYDIMRSSRLRYHYKIFNAMAEEIGTRTSAQCKSHHQKMLKRADNRLQNLLLTENTRAPALDSKQNDFRKMTDQITTNRNYPYFIVHTGKSYLIVIDERYVASY